MSGKRWTPEEEQRLRELYPTTTTREVAEILGRSENAVGQRAVKLGIRKAPGHEHDMPRPKWDDARREWFGRYAPGHSWREISAEHERIYGEPLTKAMVQGAKQALGVRSGTMGGQFVKGQESWNKGRRQADYMSAEAIGRTAGTRFKKGEIRPRKDGWYKPIGYERTDKDGTVWVKVRDSRISGPQNQRPGHWNENWKQKHRLVWERANGCEVPPNTVITFADGNHGNYDPANLVAVPRAVWSTMHKMHLKWWDADSLRACMGIAKLAHVRRKKEKEARSCRATAKSMTGR